MHRIQVPTLLAQQTNRQPASRVLATTVRMCFLFTPFAATLSVALINPLWALEETPSKADTDASERSNSETQDNLLTVNSLSTMLRLRKYEQAIERLNAFRESNPNDPQHAEFDRSLLMGLRSAKPEVAIPQYKRILEQTIRAEKLNFAEATCLSMATSDFVLRDKDLPADEKLSMLDRAIEKLEGLNPRTASFATSMIKSLTSAKIRQLASMDRYDDVKKLLDRSLATATKAIEDEKKTSIVGYLMSSIEYFSILKSRFPEESETAFTRANEVAEAFIRREDIRASDFPSYLSFKSTAISAFTKADVERSQSLLDELNQSGSALEERLDEDEVKKLATYTRSIGSLKARIDSALKHKRLIGNPAPEIDGEHFIATPPVSMNDLRGKVVLVDFWAVWCGPCIATFPHLIEWHEKYSDKGLVILGSTHRYNYRWDKETNKAMRAPSGDKVAIEEELVMLEKFREQHKLHHGFFVTPDGSQYNTEFGVYGIPQAVLIDKEGKVQMIRTGSGSANAIDLEEKIQELLKL